MKKLVTGCAGALMASLLGLAAGAEPDPSLNPGLTNGEPVAACRAGMRPFASDRGLVLLGEVIPADFPHHLPGWDAERAGYEPAAAEVAVLAAVDEPVEIVCVLGTWCSDSRREVPRFWKVLDEAANPNLKLVMLAVGRIADEQAAAVVREIGFDESPRQTYNVTLVPTFVFLRGDVELGRIVESPETTLEQAAAAILGAASAGAGKPAWE